MADKKTCKKREFKIWITNNTILTLDWAREIIFIKI